MHDAAEKARMHIEVPWDEVRSARVQRRALEAFRKGEPVEEEAPRKRSWLGPRWLWAAAAVALAVGLSLWMWPGEEPPVAQPAWTTGSALAFADGSRSLLSEQAHVQVVEDTLEHVEVRQSAGLVRYEVAPNPDRRFEVAVRDVIVTVVGTVFDVSVDGAKVMVSVERGRVRVAHGARRVELGPGERVTIEAGDGEREALRDQAPGPPPATEAPAEAATASNAPKTASPAPQTSAAEWLRRADRARAAGRHEEAIAALRALIAEHPSDRRVTHALFTLGQIERQRGRHAAAAEAFERCGAALQGDAIAEAASAWAAAGRRDRARAAAQRYLQAYPAGVHAERMRALAGGSE